MSAGDCRVFLTVSVLQELIILGLVHRAGRVHFLGKNRWGSCGVGRGGSPLARRCQEAPKPFQ